MLIFITALLMLFCWWPLSKRPVYAAEGA